jgi:hypothetical protein
VTPEVWGDKDHSVHSGIGTCADKIYARTAGLAAAFHKDGYSIQLVGHCARPHLLCGAVRCSQA